MSTANPGEVWRPTFAEQVQHLGLVEENGNQGDFIGRAYRRSSNNVRGNDPKCKGKIIKEMPGSVVSGTHCISKHDH